MRYMLEVEEQNLGQILHARTRKSDGASDQDEPSPGNTPSEPRYHSSLTRSFITEESEIAHCRPSLRMAHVLQADLIKEIVFSQYQRSRLTQQSVSHEERARIEEEAARNMRIFTQHTQTIISNSIRLIDKASNTNRTLSLLREKEKDQQKGEGEKDIDLDDNGEAAYQNNQSCTRAQSKTDEGGNTKFDRELEVILQRSATLHLMHSLANALGLLVESVNSCSHQHLSSSLLPPLAGLLKALGIVSGA